MRRELDWPHPSRSLSWAEVSVWLFGKHSTRLQYSTLFEPIRPEGGVQMFQRFLIFLAAGSMLMACSASTDPSKSKASAAAPKLASAHLGAWFWVGSSAGAKRTAIADPSRFSLDFQADGRVLIVADCNRGHSSFQLESGRLTIGAPGLTKMGCGPQSRDREFIASITQAQRLVPVGAQMQIELGDGKRMIFARSAK